MNFHLSIIDDFATKMFVHLLMGNTLILDVGAGIDKETMRVARYRLKEGRAASMKIRMDR